MPVSAALAPSCEGRSDIHFGNCSKRSGTGAGWNMRLTSNGHIMRPSSGEMVWRNR